MSCFKLIPSLTVWKKDHVILEIELNVQMERSLHIGRDLERCPETCDDSVYFFSEILF
jgi:hypothetical protein